MEEQRNRNPGDTQNGDYGRQNRNAYRPYTKEELKKMPKKERKAYLKQQYERQDALEAQLVANGAIAPRKKREGRSFLWNIIAVCLAFFLGILAALGGLVGGGYFALTKFSAKDVLNAVGADYSSLIKEDYAEKSLAQIGGEFINDLSSGLDSLGKIGKYTPIVENMLGSVGEQMETLGISLDVNAVMQVPFSEFGAYLQNEVLLKTELGKALKVDGNSSSLVKAICYGREGEDYTIDPETQAILPTETGRGATTIETLTNDTSFIGGLAVSDILEVGESSPEFLKAIQGWTIEEMSQTGRIQRLKLKQVIGMENSTSALMNAISDWRIQDLTDQNKMDTLLLSDLLVIDDSSPKILQSLKDVSLGDFHTKIDNLRLGDILGEDAIETNKILKPLKNSSIGTLSEDLKTLTVEQVFGAEIFSYMEITDGVTYRDIYSDYAAHYTEDSYNTGVDKRPQAITENNITAYYVVNGTSVRALEGYFTQSDNGVYTLLPESVSIRRETTAGIPRYYAETEQTVTPAYRFKTVNYQTNGLDELPADAVIGTDTDGETGETFDTLTMNVSNENGESALQTFRIYEDDFGFYYMNGKKRIDLEQVAVSYSYTGTDGAEVTFTVNSDGTAEDADGNPVKIYSRRNGEAEYFIKTTQQVYLQYYVPEDGNGEYTNVYGADGVTQRYEYQKDGETIQLDRYLTGVWFLLLTETDASGNIEYKTDTCVLDMSALVGETTERVTATALWELYFHRTLETNPFVKLPSSVPLPDGTTAHNLNQLTIVQTIELVRILAAGGA